MTEKKAGEADLMQKIVGLCKRRGFVFQSSEIYGGLKSAYDYGPLGVELKRNLMNEWWRTMVHEREDVVGIDASIMMHPKVWQASGHLAGFSDPLVDCLISKERFRADKAPTPGAGDLVPIQCADKGQAKTYQKAIEERFEITLKRDGKTLNGLKVIDAETIGFFSDPEGDAEKTFPYRGYVSPTFGSPFLSEERQFNLMFVSMWCILHFLQYNILACCLCCAVVASASRHGLVLALWRRCCCWCCRCHRFLLH